MPVLARLNRAGFVTSGSQPASDGKGCDGANWRQRAAVEGYASDAVLDRLRSCVRLDATTGTFPLLIAQKASRWRYRYDRAVAVTRTDGCDPHCPTRHADGCDYTWFGAKVPRHRHIRDPHMGYGICHPDAVDAVCEAWQVTVIDPEWGRNDLLWDVLDDALTTFKAVRDLTPGEQRRACVYTERAGGAVVYVDGITGLDMDPGEMVAVADGDPS